MPPTTFRPSSKPLSARHLSFAEREELAILRVQDFGVREMSRQLGRAASNQGVRQGSTTSRELRRNAVTRSGGMEYRATTAHCHAERAARRPKLAKCQKPGALRHTPEGWVAKPSVQHRRPDLEHAMGAAG